MIYFDQPTIFDPVQVRVVLSSRQDGNTKPEWSPLEDTITNIGAIASHIQATTDDIIAMDVGANQHKWDEIIDVTDAAGRGVSEPAGRVAADALVTRQSGAVLMLPVADCNAVAMHHSAQGLVALVHLGWQSTVADLASKVVRHLDREYGAAPDGLRVYFSPAIKAESYVFDSVSQADDPMWQDFLCHSEQGIGVDLPGYNQQRLIEAGVRPEHIQISPINTAVSPDYFSHYRAMRSGEPEGRFVLMVGLK